jgi:RING finger protein 113A
MQPKNKQFRKRVREDDNESTVNIDQHVSVVLKNIQESISKPPAILSTTSVKQEETLSDSKFSEKEAAERFAAAAQASSRHDIFASKEVDAGTDQDGQALYEKKLASKSVLDERTGKEIYQGLNSYSNFVQVNATEALSKNKITGTHGPLRAPTNVRGILRVDYAPDICKDYKETGYCGFGDNCIFLHDRGDYKLGWQIERDWKAKQDRKNARLAAKLAAGGALDEGDDAESSSEGEDAQFQSSMDRKYKKTTWSSWKESKQQAGVEKDLPFACHLCRKPFSNPVVTTCGHYFCESCILDSFKENPLCPVCERHTHGIFQSAAKALGAGVQEKREQTPESMTQDGPGEKKAGGWEAVSD